MCCEIVIAKSQFRHTFVVCKKLQQEQILVLMCNYYPIYFVTGTNDGQMFLHQGTNILINSTDSTVDTAKLKNY